MKRSSSLDCSSIGQSLKRVKISTSPGELRLDRDIESLILGKRWTSTASEDNCNSAGSNGSSSAPSWDRRGSRIHGELYCPNARLIRDPVDPLRLRLTCLHQPMSPNNNLGHGYSPSSSPIPPERWTFMIQMPRMYPHVPPAITRVTRDLVPNNENMAHLGNMNMDYGYGSASAAMVASSLMQSHVEPPVPDQVLINPLPPTPHSMGATHSHNGNGGNAHGGSTKLLDIDSATAVFNEWSPVSSLQDLIDFLRGIPSRRREWWSVESNKMHHLEQQRMFRYHGGAGHAPVGQPTIAPASSSFFQHHQHPQQHQHQHQQQQHHHFQPVLHPKEQHHFATTHCDMEDDGDVECMMEDGRTERRINPFTANRFDVGYDRGALIRQHQQWGVR